MKMGSVEYNVFVNNNGWIFIFSMIQYYSRPYQYDTLQKDWYITSAMKIRIVCYEN
jgi:hypothetical protein